MELLELDGKKWRNLTGLDAVDRNERKLGEITDHYVDNNEMIFVINDEYEISTFEVDHILLPNEFIRFNMH